jgi:hypothetical protein
MAWNQAQRLAFRSSNPIIGARVSMKLAASIKRAARDAGLSMSDFIRKTMAAVSDPEIDRTRTFQPKPRNERGQFRAVFAPTPEWEAARSEKRRRNSLAYFADGLAHAQAEVNEHANVARPLNRLSDKPRNRPE